MSHSQNGRTDGRMLDELQRETLDYFLHESNPANGLVRDKTTPNSPASIAATGLALTVYPVGVERAFLSRSDALDRTLAALRFFAGSDQSDHASATGHQGFFYHFLDMRTGRRAWRSELSTIDSALLFAGMLTAAAYFTRDDGREREVRERADELYARANWRWAQDDQPTVRMGWTPESGFLDCWWEGYNEALVLQILALGAPRHALPPETYAAWTRTYEWRTIYGYELLYAGPLFIHQLSHLWIDFREIRDDFMRTRGLDYFENSRRATYIQHQYAVRNPLGFAGYDDLCWGITASDGPGDVTRKINGVDRRFFDYLARGAPFGPDDGTIAPWTVVASLPFAPDIVIPTTRHFIEVLRLKDANPYGFKATINPTFTTSSGAGWVSPCHYGINQGPIIAMIENYRTGMIWDLMRRSPPIATGLARAGFTPAASTPPSGS